MIFFVLSIFVDFYWYSTWQPYFDAIESRVTGWENEMHRFTCAFSMANFFLKVRIT